MLYGLQNAGGRQDRSAMRRVFAEAWRKACAKEPLEPLQRQVADIVAMHSEYHALLIDESAVDRDFAPDDGAINPFMHMGLHIALQEQVTTDRPVGIRGLYAEIVRRRGDVHAAEHAMMDCLGAALYQAQSSGRPPDEKAYFAALRALT